jgi:hypothetical protein
VGFHHQPDLSPVYQELSGRRASAEAPLDLKRRSLAFVSRLALPEGRQGRLFHTLEALRPLPGRFVFEPIGDQRPAGAEKPPLYRAPADQSTALLALRNC